ncbi:MULTISPECIES: ABC transporter substrate-binding protein [Paenibacillus]|uniref:ABC transporter substrate-binding protein n=1 Tax=Paenibacillus TaxID=44249 RepID=UPI001F26A0D4|nr:ABC transporter substrate-binding protein [Paenibacillus sp. JJ-223]CAH1227855.1 Fe(3+)-citrate-binding protein YfmC [Paenibacillus sp. JJ-223]
MYRKKYKNRGLLAALIVLVFMLAACSGQSESGQTQTDTRQSANEKAENSKTSVDPESTEEANVTYPRTIQDARGSVTLEQQPKRVALAHWGLSDDLLVFELDSIAITLPFTKNQSLLDSDIYKPYVEGKKQIEVVGENTQVNLEALLAYDPDLIIAGSETNKDIIEQLDQIAPTIVIDETKSDVFKEWRATINEFGNILGQEETAQKYISDFDGKLAEGKNKLASMDGTVAFLQIREKQAYLQGKDYITEYYEGLGLTPPSTEAGELTLEGLAELDPDYLFLGYFNMEDPSLPAVSDEWEKSAVWKGLKAVRNGHVYKINGQIAFGFGPISKNYGVEAIVHAAQAE